jgi:hypothetical protein
MLSSDSTELFPAGHTETTWMMRGNLTGALMVRFDGITALHANHPDPSSSTIRLSLEDQTLTDEAARDLLELLVGVPGVLPPCVTPDDFWCVPVEVHAPDTVTDHELTWTVTGDLSVWHTDIDDAFLSWTEPARRDTTRPPFVELTYRETWKLACALTSLRYWHARLRERYAGAATTTRRGLGSISASSSAAPNRTNSNNIV